MVEASLWRTIGGKCGRRESIWALADGQYAEKKEREEQGIILDLGFKYRMDDGTIV